MTARDDDDVEDVVRVTLWDNNAACFKRWPGQPADSSTA